LDEVKNVSVLDGRKIVWMMVDASSMDQGKEDLFRSNEMR